MYLKSIEVKDIKCFAELRLDFTSDAEQSGIRRWTSLLGENGVGKSTLLKAIGAALAGPTAMRQLLPFPESWVRADESHGEIRAELLRTGEDEHPSGKSRKHLYTARYYVSGGADRSWSSPQQSPVDNLMVEPFAVWPEESTKEDFMSLSQTAYAEKATGWLACGYGPFRRLSGGGEIPDQIVSSGRRSARFVTLFYESAALTDVDAWLKQLYNTARDGDRHNEKRLELIRQAFRERLLPLPAELLVDARQARLKVGDQEPVAFDGLSDGYRSMLALGVDLMRWLTAAFPEAEEPMGCPGVVLVDELDAHLHPKWQREIGLWLLDKFPRLQFIVATHSPFLAQVASEPRGNIVLQRTVDGIRVRSDLEAVTTWRADQILRELFDIGHRMTT